ncbi:MAG: SDR family oxidoreductase [Verrucomicrobia bacterium]|nr:SDR family oxidoreductase [Verrucomicrobiota bacterium]
MDFRLQGKLALVTASTAGIGAAIAEGLAREGARVIVNGRTQERVDSAIDGIRARHPAAELEGFSGDLSNPETVRGLTDRFPHVDILVNNLGIFEPRPFTEISDDDWRRFFEVNVLSGVRLSRFYFPKMLKSGWGRVIFMSSESALNIPVEMIHYGMTKTAQLAVSRGLADLTAGTGVTVNSVLPGPTASEGVSGFIRDLAAQNNQSVEEVEHQFFEKARPTSLLKRFASTEEVANLVVYLASEAASATNGSALRVDGGTVNFIA